MSPSLRCMAAALAACVAVLTSCTDASGPTVGPPAELALTSAPTAAQAGAVFTATVEIRDAAGAVVTSATDAITMALGTSPSGATLSGTTTVSAVAGVGTFTGLWLDKTGSYTLVASSGTLPSATSAPFAVAPGPPHHLAFTGQPPAFVVVNLALGGTVAVAIVDAFDNVVPTAVGAVTLAIGNDPGGGGAVLSGTLTENAVSGVAAFSDLTLDQAGVGYTLAAGAGGLTGESMPFTVGVWTDLSPGGGHTCGVTTGGVAYCWGANTLGQLGNGTTAGATQPVPVAGGLTFAAVSAGSNHSCGLTTGGTVYCWGRNGRGELGDGTTTDRSSPVPAAVSLAFAGVRAGGGHSCAVTAAGVAYCWGSNDRGQLGNGAATAPSTAPTLVSGMRTFTDVSPGGSHACAIETGGGPGGPAYCWGLNADGQVGDSTTTDRTAPVLVSGGLSFIAVAAGRFTHTCGLTPEGAAHCWGSNLLGRLGDGTTGSSASPVAVLGEHSFVALGPGGSHSCGLVGGGAARCWGRNVEGQLGDGTTTNRAVPTLVSGSISFVTVRGGHDHTCGISVSGAAYCWGDNGLGQVGDGTTTNRSAPERVMNP